MFHFKVIFAVLLSAGLLRAQDKEVGLTVYNDNLALVKDVRSLQLKQGLNELKFRDVAAQIDPTSVYFLSLTAPEKVAILEQNYEYDLVNESKILQKYVDRTIRLETKDGSVYSGKLLTGSGGQLILQDKDGLKIINRATIENIAFPELPEGLITRPTLLWQLDCQQAGRHQVEIGYLTQGLAWHAEYVGVTNADDSQLEVSGWVSIDNQSGATYKNARLKLVAGDVHRAKPPQRFLPAETLAMRAEKAPEQFSEKAFFEYHLYTLERRATVANNQIKQIALFPPAETAVNKKYTYFAARDPRHVRVNLEFTNDKKSGLGRPLPKGKFRVYKRDTDGALIFVGEDFIAHTAKDEKVSVYVGDAFDIVPERRQKAYRTIGKRTWEQSWEIKLRNHKSQAVTVAVRELLPANWEITESSHDYVKKDAQTIEFAVSVRPDREEVVQYTVRYTRL